MFLFSKQHYPKTELRVASNLVNIRTCADSLSALIDLIRYFAADSDLYPPAADGELPEQTQPEPDVVVS